MPNVPSSVNSLRYKTVDVGGTYINYAEVGTGNPIVFLHGNPTSSYLWRNIVPFLADQGRCLVPDLLGMGNSGASPTGSYRFADHMDVLDEWFVAVGATKNVTLVLHDWGAALGFYRAARFPEQFKAFAYMEALIQPRTWAELPANRREIFSRLRSSEGERMVLDENFLVETVLPHSVLRTLSHAEMDTYRQPFNSPKSRLPTLTWARELPIGGEPADVTRIVLDYSDWLAKSQHPKLLIPASHGTILVGRLLDLCRTWPNQREAEVVQGGHYLQEDSPVEIGRAISSFVAAL
jgi:haloalkane dehalogenase